MSTRPQLVFIPGEGEGGMELERGNVRCGIFFLFSWQMSEASLLTYVFTHFLTTVLLSLSLFPPLSLSRSLSFISLSFIMFFLVFLSLNLPVCISINLSLYTLFIFLHSLFVILFVFSIVTHFICLFVRLCGSFLLLYLCFPPLLSVFITFCMKQ